MHYLPIQYTLTLQHPHTHTHTHAHTHYVASHSGDEVDDAHPQPTDCPLDLEPNIQLHWHDGHHVKHTEVYEDGEEESPELVGLGEVGGVRVNPHGGSVEPTYPLQAVYF